MLLTSCLWQTINNPSTQASFLYLLYNPVKNIAKSDFVYILNKVDLWPYLGGALKPETDPDIYLESL